MEEKFVSTFEAACTKLGISDELPDVSAWPEQLQKHLTATYKLSRMLEVNNGNWVPDLAATQQWKYFPAFEIIKEGASGFRLSSGGYGCAYSFTYLGVRLACRTSELAQFMGATNPSLYKDLLS